MRAKLTCLVPCKNEAANIEACIESFREIADEVLIADSGSTDETKEIVRALGGCKLIEREFVNYADFKNWAIPQATNEWVLIVDADERITPELAAEIRALLENPPANCLGRGGAELLRRRRRGASAEGHHVAGAVGHPSPAVAARTHEDASFQH